MQRQFYEDLLNNLIDNIEEENLSETEIEDIKLALENVKGGHLKPIEQIAKELALLLNKMYTIQIEKMRKILSKDYIKKMRNSF